MDDKITEEQRIKNRTITLLRHRFRENRDFLQLIEPRLAAYYDELCIYSSAEAGDTYDRHNCGELLCALKFLRLARTYSVDVAAIKAVVYKYEGEWREISGIWEHVRGGVRHPGNSGSSYYRLQPFQVFILASIFGMFCKVNTWDEAGTRELLPTEEVIDGYIFDRRRLCTEFTLYTPRKTAKTQLSAFIQFVFFMDGDHNAECYCAANSSDQSKILFNRTKDLIRQLDPKEKRIRFTQTAVNWCPGQFRSASLTALSAGGKTKDGLFAQLCSADEYGSAPYVNGSSDMGKLVAVIESSMGPRREPMTFITTTAGTITQGPFIDKLRGIEAELQKELERCEGDGDGVLEDVGDRHMALLFQPDVWERDAEYLFTHPHVRRKINPMLGLIVKHSFYDEEIEKARTGGNEKLNDVLAKDFNVYTCAKTTRWKVTSDDIRRCQHPTKRVTDCQFGDGWQTFVGLDFSDGGDINGITYLSVDMRPTGSMTGRWFADCEAWICEDELESSPNRPLYEKWVADGWLKVCPGKVFDADLAIHELMKKSDAGVNLVYFGYDPAKSAHPINTLKAWLQTLGIEAQTIRQMVVPVPQGFVTISPLMGYLEHMILNAEGPWIEFSASPLWPWQAGNAKEEESSYGNRKLVKASASQKVDNIQALLDALYCFNLNEGNIDQNAT